MSVNTENIIFGAANVYVGAYGATEPTTATGTIDPLQFVHVGGTTDGVKFNYEPEYQTINIDQVYGAVGARKIGHEMSIETVLAEATLENFKTLLGGGTITESGTTRTFDLASLTGGNPDYLAILFRGPGPDGKIRTFIARKCLATGSVEFTYAKDEQSGLTAQWSVYETGTEVKALRIMDEIDAV